LTNKLVKWYKKNKRDLPWRYTKDPYHIWVSEIILQQTKIKTGLSYYLKFLDSFPDIYHLASATENQVLNVWQGLGYYQRALNMLSTAKNIVNNNNGIFPKKYKQLIQLKGIGPYTAAAISSICNNEQQGVVDGNVYRVLSRFYNISEPINTSKGAKIFQNIANKLVPEKSPGRYNQAIMDFGATQCKKYNPSCLSCPLNKDCAARKLNLIDLRPIKSKMKKYRLRYFHYLFITNEKKIIIQKRENNDIWEKLYQLPLIEGIGPLQKNVLHNHKILNGINVLQMRKKKTIKHILSHQKLEITFWIINVKHFPKNNSYQKINLKDIANYPFAKPLKKFLEIQARNT